MWRARVFHVLLRVRKSLVARFTATHSTFDSWPSSPNSVCGCAVVVCVCFSFAIFVNFHRETMSSGQWEVVGRNKKEKINNQTTKKPGKVDKKRVAAAPKVEDILPLSQVKNIYATMGKNKENKKPVEKEVKAKEVVKKQVQKKVPEVVKVKTPRNIESALNSINVQEFNDSFEMSKSRFPDAPLVWLKELSAILNARLALDLNDPVFSTKPDTYPLNVVPAGLKQVMEKAMLEAGKPAVQLFFDITLTAMANDMSRGQAALGHKLWIQFLAQNNPQLCALHLDKHISLRTSYQNRQPIGLSILWSLGQGGTKDFHVGMKVFKDFMLPLLEMKNYTRYIVKYLSQLLNKHDNVQLSKDNYVFLQELITTKRSIPNDVALELSGLNKLLKAMLFAKDGDKKYTVFFEMFLAKLSTEKSTIVKNDTCDTLVACLSKDTTCYSTWIQLYPKQYQQSSILLKYINDHWKKLSPKFDKKLLKELLNTFTGTNTELFTKNKKDTALQENITICKALLDKMTVTKSFPWKSLSFTLIVIAGSLLAYDFNRHGCWPKTQSVRTLKDIGVWEYGERAWLQAHHGYNWTRQRIEEYAPGYLDAAGDAIQPYVEVSRDAGIILYNIGRKSIRIVQAKVPVVLDSIETYAPGLQEQIHTTWQKLSTTSVDYYNQGYKYVTTEVFVGQLAPEHLHKVLSTTLDATQKYATDYYNWICEKIQTTIHGK